jgi:hypothetical protein
LCNLFLPKQIDIININSSRYIEKHKLDAWSKNIKDETEYRINSFYTFFLLEGRLVLRLFLGRLSIFPHEIQAFFGVGRAAIMTLSTEKDGLHGGINPTG